MVRARSGQIAGDVGEWERDFRMAGGMPAEIEKHRGAAGTGPAHPRRRRAGSFPAHRFSEKGGLRLPV